MAFSADDLVKLTLGDLVEPPGVRKSGPLDTVSGARKLPRPDGGLRWVEIGRASCRERVCLYV